MNARTCKRHRLTGARGFTLIEVILVTVIIAILAAISIPQYSEYVNRSRRADAQAFLIDVAARQQHYLVDRRMYGTSITASVADGGLAMTIPRRVSDFYDVTVATVNNPVAPAPPTPTFTLSAAPRGAQSGDRCGTLRVDQTGERATSTGAAGCWSRTGT